MCKYGGTAHSAGTGWQSLLVYDETYREAYIETVLERDDG